MRNLYEDSTPMGNRASARGGRPSSTEKSSTSVSVYRQKRCNLRIPAQTTLPASSMCSSCQTQPASAGAEHGSSRGANYCGPQRLRSSTTLARARSATTTYSSSAMFAARQSWWCHQQLMTTLFGRTQKRVSHFTCAEESIAVEVSLLMRVVGGVMQHWCNVATGGMVMRSQASIVVDYQLTAYDVRAPSPSQSNAVQSRGMQNGAATFSYTGDVKGRIVPGARLSKPVLVLIQNHQASRSLRVSPGSGSHD
jgi:hypothetical protein